MCLSIPGKVTEIGKKIIVDYGEEKREADFSLEKVGVGDYVIVNNKIIIAKVPKEKAEEFFKSVVNGAGKNG